MKFRGLIGGIALALAMGCGQALAPAKTDAPEQTAAQPPASPVIAAQPVKQAPLPPQVPIVEPEPTMPVTPVKSPPVPVPTEPQPEPQPEEEIEAEVEEIVAEIDPPTTIEPTVEVAGDTDGLRLLGEVVAPGTTKTLHWSASQFFEGIGVPVLVVNGAQQGPTVCLTAAVHGDELNGIEIVRRVVHALKPEKLTGAVVGIPIVNVQGFHSSSRYLADRRDLNRFFPGNPTGSSASRIAHSLFNSIVRHCDALVDLHTGSFHRTNLPQLRADLTNERIVELTKGFGATVVLHSVGAEGTLRRAAVEAGVPAVTLEAGEPLRLQEDAVRHGVKGVNTLLAELGMYKKRSFWGAPEPVYYMSKWIRADVGGILLTNVKLGKRVKAGDVLGTVTDPISNETAEILSPYEGRVLGMALNQVVHPGFAAFRVGIKPKSGSDKIDIVQSVAEGSDDDDAGENSEE